MLKLSERRVEEVRTRLFELAARRLPCEPARPRLHLQGRRDVSRESSAQRAAAVRVARDPARGHRQDAFGQQARMKQRPLLREVRLLHRPPPRHVPVTGDPAFGHRQAAFGRLARMEQRLLFREVHPLHRPLPGHVRFRIVAT